MEIPPVRVLKDYDLVLSYIDWLADYGGSFAYDYETWGDKTALRPELNTEFKILCVGVATIAEAVCFPIDYPNYWTLNQRATIAERWSRLIADREAIAHNAKYEHKCNFKRFPIFWCYIRAKTGFS